MSKTFLFQAIQFSQTALIQPIQFSICIDFVYTQLNVKTVIYITIQFSVSTYISIGYYLERVKQYIPALLRCFKCQKYGHYREDCRGWHTCAKCREKYPGHMEEDCLKEIRSANWRQDHPAYARSCDVYKKEKEILEVKHKRNVSFLEARKIVGTYMRENSYTSVARRMNTNNQDNKYRTLMEKLIQLEANDWHQKNLHPAKF